MKTFKLVSFQLVDDQEKRQSVSLTNGLIINKEDGENNWILEAVIDKKWYDEFHVLLKDKQKITVEAKITKETNDPATFIATVASITSIGENRISLLMKGVLKERRLHYAEMLLEDLINQGLSGHDLLQQFKLQLRNRPIKSTSKK
ncbi:YwpF-like family protein [Priestia megaterium]|uniref:YwpF-like family protein n=1 Tax=Priestia megaterium TaxID=1404 RepID=UPI00034C3134|nr:YwpF-like family protein [Priestia megaterium]AYE48629.1 hypothetical protein OEA_02175 [Priestia megaterium NCT-2]QSF39051.1 YwpF-like family protein [Priestia megaterium]UMZ33059.1 YwpF-like family protein [Priestia megaterium]